MGKQKASFILKLSTKKTKADKTGVRRKVATKNSKTKNSPNSTKFKSKAKFKSKGNMQNSNPKTHTGGEQGTDRSRHMNGSMQDRG